MRLKRWKVVGFLCLLAGIALGACGDSSGGPDQTQSEDACQSTPLRGYGFDRYGGWKGIHRAGTGRFAVAEVDGRWWLFTPDGNAFFANGASGIEPVGDRIMGTSTSPYHDAIIAKHGSEEAWAGATFTRLCQLGMRTLGGWIGLADVELFHGRIAYTVNYDAYRAMPEVPTAPPSLQPRRDVFVPDAEARAVRSADQGLVANCAVDPWCIGVFVENEVPYAPALFSGGSHVDVYLSQPAGAPGKLALQEFLSARYGGDLAQFNGVWNTALESWDDLQNLSELGDCAVDSAGWQDDICFLRERPGTRLEDRIAFEAEVAGRIARIADEALDALAPGMLNLGPRLVVSPYPPAIVKALSEPVDVVSVNNYDVEALANAILPDDIREALEAMGALGFDPFGRLQQVHAITGKPIIVSEWFYRRLRPGVFTLPPFLPEVPDGAAQAAAVTNYLGHLLDMPFIVGEHWFQWQDQPIEGRFDGENQLIGIVDINDDVNQPLFDTLSNIYGRLIEQRLEAPRP